MEITRDNLKIVKEKIIEEYMNKEELDKIKGDIYKESEKVTEEFNKEEEEEIDE